MPTRGGRATSEGEGAAGADAEGQHQDEVIDLASYQTAATADVGKQAGGISFWRVE